MKVEPQTMSCTDLSGNKKSPDQKAKADYGKAKLSLVPRRIIWDIAAIREYGNEKYHDPDNWKQVEAERYRDALYRHFMKYLDDPYGVDSESGFPHLWHVACNVAFLCELDDAEMEKIRKEQRLSERAEFVRSEKEQAMLKTDDGYTPWLYAFREHGGEAEFYRRSIFTDEIQFGDYNPELMRIVPRKTANIDIHDTDFE